MEPLRPRSKRRVVSAEQSIEEAIKARKEAPVAPATVPKSYRPLSDLARLDRQLYLADLALNEYHRKLEQGFTLSGDEQKLFLAHQDSLRKLETTRAALKAKSDLSHKTDLEIAQGMIDLGMTLEQVLTIYEGNKEVERGLLDK